MKISLEFSKHASSYDLLNTIQDEVADKLLSHVLSKPKNILDLGCGNGSLCKKISWKYKHFVGVDFAPAMLELHPKSKKIECIYGNFNDKELFENLLTYKFDYIISSSALQWAEDIEMIFRYIKRFDAPIALAIFTDGTFRSINKTASLPSLLKNKKEIKELALKYFDVSCEVVKYKLEFNSIRDMFKYIKKSGVSGARNILNYKQTKELYRNYPLNYLEFEVVFITSFSKS